MICVICEKCGKEVTMPGGLGFSPPFNLYGQVTKRHLCVGCYWLFIEWLSNPIKAKKL